LLLVMFMKIIAVHSDTHINN
jgi:hypothetical protein